MIQKAAVIKIVNSQKCRRFLFDSTLRPASNMEIIFFSLRRSFGVVLGILRYFANLDTHIGVARIFDWGGANHKLRAMTSLEIFEKGSFCGTKVS